MLPNRPFIRFLCLPDIDRAIGGVKQLYRHVEHLVALGFDAAVVTEHEGFRPSWFDSPAPSVSLQSCYELLSSDPLSVVLVLPETYLNCNLHNFYGLDISSYPRVIFNQNAYYSYGQYSPNTSELIQSFYRSELVLQVLSVSEDTSAFLSTNLLIPDDRISRVINSIEPFFSPASNKSNILHWMPRKNPDHVQAVIHAIQAARSTFSSGWNGLPLESLSHREVANNLNQARIFLSFGHPEGFGLPIAEAMASGCWVIGYTGGGGRELFRFGGSSEIAFGDWTEFVSATENAFKSFSLHPREMANRLERQSLAIRTLYSREQEHQSIRIAWERILFNYQELLSSTNSDR